MSNLVKTQKDKFSKSNKTSTKIMLMGSLSALLAACGGGTTAPTGSKTLAPTGSKTLAPTGSKTLAPKSDPADPKSDPNAKVADGKTVNVIRANDGSEAQTGKSGEDIFIVVGSKMGTDYTVEDVKTVNGISIDLSAYISADDINQAVIADLAKGGSLDGAEDGAVLVTFGKVDLSATELKNIHKIIVKGEITLDHAQISSDLKEIMGETSSVLSIKDSVNTVEVNLSNVNLDGITKLVIGENVTVRMTNDQASSLKEINGSGAFENVFKDQMLKVTHLEKQDAKANGGTDADDKLNGTDQNDELKGFDGEDVLNAGAGEDALDGGAGNDILIDDDEAADTFLGGEGRDYFVILGNKGAKTYTEADLLNPMGHQVDFRDAMNVDQLNNMGSGKTYENNHYDGQEDGAVMVVFGDLDLTGFTLKNITELVIDGEVTLTADQLTTLAPNITGTGNTNVGASQSGDNGVQLSKFTGSDNAHLSIVGGSSTQPIKLNLSQVDLNGIKVLEMSDHVEIVMTQTQLDNLDQIEGTGQLINVEADVPFNFDNVEVSSDVDVVASAAMSIIGIANEGNQLTASVTNFKDPNVEGTPSFNYSWYRDGEMIDGEMSQYYTLTQADVNAEISFNISYTDDNNQTETLSSNKSAAVGNVNDAPTGGVSIFGNAREDSVLSADVSKLMDEDGLGELSYQWLRDGVEIPDATANSYQLTQTDVNAQITVKVSYTDDFNQAEMVTSAPTEAVQNLDDATMGNAVITGTARLDETLTANWQNLSDEDGVGNVTYKWFANNVEVAGETGPTLLMTQGMVGRQIKVEMQHTDAFNNVTTSVSSETAAVENFNKVATATMSISGTVREKETLTATYSNVQDGNGYDGGAVDVQWYRDGVMINGATDATYTLTQADVGKQMSYSISFNDATGHKEVLTSSKTAAVSNVNDAPTGGVSIFGNAREDSVLSADVSNLKDEDGLGELSYQWLRDGVEIPDATANSYQLTQTDVNAQISVKVSYTDDFNQTEMVTSAPTSAVQNVQDATMGNAVITGTARLDETLTANWQNLSDEDGVGNVTYKWFADNVEVTGQTGSTLLMTQALVGKKIKAELQHTDAFGDVTISASSETVAVENFNKVATATMSISGNVRVKETLTATYSNVQDGNGYDGGAVDVQWFRDGEAIDGATSINYVVTDQDVGAEIHATIKFQDDAGYDETLTFAKTDVVHLPNLFDIDKASDALVKNLITPNGHFSFGEKFNNIGDMNGDGYDDFLVRGRTINTETNGYNYKVFVVFGDKDRILEDINFDQLDGSNGLIIEYSDVSKQIFPYSGDYNGDGLSDLIIKGVGIDDSTDTEIMINPNYVIWGQKDGFDPNIKLGEALEGKIEKYYDKINADTKSILHEVATFNDFNGDGYNDLVAKIEDRDINGNIRPNVTLKFGSEAMLTEDDSIRNTNSDNSVHFSRTEPHILYTPNLAGDINGDGFDDLILHRLEKGIYKLDSAVVFGTDKNLYEQFINKPEALDALNGQDGFTIKQDGAHAKSQIGNGHGDFNGDGYDDLIIRSYKYKDDNTDNGFYVLYGKKDGFNDNYNLSDLKDEHGLQLTTKTKRIIQGVEYAGDVNGDGLDDLFLQALYNKVNVDGTIHNGKAYVIYGQKNGDVTNFDLENLEEDQGVIIYQSSAVDRKKFANTLTSAGDINHDGYDDIYFISNDYKTDEATGQNVVNSDVKILYGGDHLSNPNMADAKENDLVEGTAGDDALLGGLGDDVLKGAAGDDSLRGGNGDDLLDGGAGRDLLKGGGGSDIFKFAAGDSNIEITGSGENGHIKGFDIIRDFETNKADLFGEKIVVEGGAIIAADATVDGNDSTLTIKDGNKGEASTVKSHKIENGVITFDNEDQYSEAIDIASFGGIIAVIEYLQNQDLGDAGTSVVFDNGANSYLFVQGDDDGTNDQDVVVRLDNVQVDSLIDEAAYGYQDLLIA